MRRIGVMLSAVWIVVAVAAGASPVRAGEPIRIGAIFSVTGPASFLGEPERNTAKMLEEELNRAGGLLGPDSARSSSTMTRAMRPRR